MSRKNISNKEIYMRQWFAANYGNKFEDHAEYELPHSNSHLFREYCRDNPEMKMAHNSFVTWIRDVAVEIKLTGTFNLHDDMIKTDYLDSVDYTPQTRESQSAPGGGIESVKAVELNIQKLDEMEFPSFRDFPTGTIFDRICSDDDQLTGLMSGMVVICTGESGVGKSTLLIDVLSKIKNYSEESEDREDVETLYISTEMTKTDLYFYKKKMPAIGKVNTMLVADYMERGLREAITKAFRAEEYDVILLDSYQDLVEKLQDVLNWRSKEAENFMIQLMVEAAEENGKSIIAIQHLTKGGAYVGRTFLKHTTTAMLELRFDKAGGRYAMFSKNRRGGSMTHVPMYFNLVDGEVVFDELQFDTMLSANEMNKSAESRAASLSQNFNSMFDIASRALDEEDEEEGGLDALDSDDIMRIVEDE